MIEEMKCPYCGETKKISICEEGFGELLMEDYYEREWIINCAVCDKEFTYTEHYELIDARNEPLE